jgi:putative tryptophan/tyrosine transport system substrate-binding protein
MKRREFIALLGGAAAAAGLRPLGARAQGSTKPRRIGVLSQDLAGAHPTPLFQTFLQGLRELGWLEGHNLAIEWRFSEGSLEPLPRLAAELVALPVELIVASPARPARVAKEATGTIPVVFIQVPDPVALGIVTSLARPGANVTGLSSIASDLTGKRLALVKEILPDAMNIALLWNRPSEGSALVFHEMNRVKHQVGLELEDIGISDGSELQKAFASAVRARVAAVMVIDDPVMTYRRAKVMQLAADHRLPVFSQYSEYVDSGALISYGPSLTAIYRRGATYVDRILKGAKPNELPVEQPVVFEMVINLRTAKVLGLEVPPTLLARADEVIE